MTALIFKSLAVLLITASLVIIISSQRPEYGFALSLAGGIVVILFVLEWMMPQLNELKTRLSGAGAVIAPFSMALKALGISYITGFAADTCRDFGQTALAAKAEFVGRCAIFLLCVPYIISVLESTLKFAKV